MPVFITTLMEGSQAPGVPLWEPLVIDRHSELHRRPMVPERDRPRTVVGRKTARHPTNAEAISAGLEFLSSNWHEKVWGETLHVDVAAAAYILLLLGEMPKDHLNPRFRGKISEAASQLAKMTFNPGLEDNLHVIGLAAAALQQHKQPVPEPWIDFIRRCHRDGGGFTMHPRNPRQENSAADVNPELTAIAIKVLRAAKLSDLELLAQHLRNDGVGNACSPSQLFVASTIFDWEAGIAPRSLINQVRKMAECPVRPDALEKALLLRCLVRLRILNAWTIAAELRGLQQHCGSWNGSGMVPGLADRTVSTDASCQVQVFCVTATVLSALALEGSQPGLYFGSDLPYRRL